MDDGVLESVGTEGKVEELGRPVWSMDIVILSNINQIIKITTDWGIEFNSGNDRALIPLIASMKELFYSMESFIDESDRIDIEKVLTTASQYIDYEKKEINISNRGDIVLLMDALSAVRRKIYWIRNKVFIKYAPNISTETLIQRYAHGRGGGK